MTGFKNLILAFTVLSASTAALASDDIIASLAPGKTSEKLKKSLTLSSFSMLRPVGNESAWSAHLHPLNNPTDYFAGYANVSVTHNGFKLGRENFKGRYDLS